jgi:hypothetical protein
MSLEGEGEAMLQASRRSIFVVMAGLFVMATLCGPASAQTMSFSFYTNTTVNADGTMVSDVTAYDGSSGCTHGNYTLTVTMYGPSGGTAASSGQMHTTVSLQNGDGDYTVSSSLRYLCSCMNNSYVSVGNGQTANRSTFRAVFQYNHPNGNKYEYSGMCAHSCQPSRVCLSVRRNFAYFNGFKVITPVASQCRASSIMDVSDTYAANPCIGSGAGSVIAGWDPMCPF